MAGLRMRRLLDGRGHCLMLPMDHQIGMGALRGLEDPGAVLDAVAPHATCTTVHRGLVRRLASPPRLGLLMHLSASTVHAPDPDDKRLVGSVVDAVRLGCDGVSIHVNLGSATEADQLQSAGRVASACLEWGMPLVAMVYPRGPSIDPDVPDNVVHAARLGAEFGADMVKVPYVEDFGHVVQAAGIPVLVAGGGEGDLDALLTRLRAARDAGARGVSAGRHVFQAEDPAAAMREVATVFR